MRTTHLLTRRGGSFMVPPLSWHPPSWHPLDKMPWKELPFMAPLRGTHLHGPPFMAPPGWDPFHRSPFTEPRPLHRTPFTEPPTPSQSSLLSGQTNTSENITFPQLRLWVVIKSIISHITQLWRMRQSSAHNELVIQK